MGRTTNTDTQYYDTFDAEFIHSVTETPGVSGPDEFQLGLGRGGEMASRHAFADHGTRLVPL